MRVRCISTKPDAGQQELLGRFFREGQEFPVEIGRAYTPIGVGYWSGVTWLEIAENDRVVAPVPLFLFEILDGAPSQHWVLESLPDGGATLWPPLLYERAFHDRLLNGDSDLVERFADLMIALEAEYAVGQ